MSDTPAPTHRLYSYSYIAEVDWKPTHIYGVPGVTEYEQKSFTDYEWRPIESPWSAEVSGLISAVGATEEPPENVESPSFFALESVGFRFREEWMASIFVLGEVVRVGSWEVRGDLDFAVYTQIGCVVIATRKPDKQENINIQLFTLSQVTP